MEGTLSGTRGAGARAELAASDPVMAELVDRLGEWTIGDRRRGLPKPDAYGALLRTIVGQQLSTKAARTIHERVLGLFGGRTPTPEELLAVSEEDLRGAGLSGRKVTYIRDLAAHVKDGELELDRLDELSDEEVIEEIVAVRGLGRWSAEMFLMFHLERPDVFSGGDLGLRRAIQVAYGLEEMPTPEEAVERAERWRPHRTLAAVYLWESLAMPTPG
jgi:DNA-3-methyladenine glycosylase II